MIIICVSIAFLYAISGNHIVQFDPGNHEIHPDIAKIAVDDLKIATIIDSNADLQQKITHDIYQNELTEAQIAQLYPEIFPEKTPKKAKIPTKDA